MGYVVANILKLESLFQRTKERVKGLGEVFTPDKYVESMLDLLSADNENFWSSEDNVFFEPSCGHGNIVTAIYKRRLLEIYKVNFQKYSKNTAYYAVSNALNTICGFIFLISLIKFPFGSKTLTLYFFFFNALTHAFPDKILIFFSSEIPPIRTRIVFFIFFHQ